MGGEGKSSGADYSTAVEPVQTAGPRVEAPAIPHVVISGWQGQRRRPSTFAVVERGQELAVVAGAAQAVAYGQKRFDLGLSKANRLHHPP